jgi:hypothetical protein
MIGLAFAILFTALGVLQYSFLRYELRDRTKADLQDYADEMHDEIAYENEWNLEGYHRSSEGPETYVVLSSDGTLIDTHGFLGPMLSHVTLPFSSDRDRVITFHSEVGEDWRLYIHDLTDALVIIGVRAEVAPDHLLERFAENAARFGTTLATATRTPERAIHETFDYAILDRANDVQWAIGGIPLKAAKPKIPARSRLISAQQIGTKRFASLTQPIVNKSGNQVGVVSVYEDITDEQHVLHQSAIFNLGVAGILWVTTLGIGAIYVRRTVPEEVSCSRILTLDESDTIEFKSSLRWDHEIGGRNPELERAVVKTVVAFLNSESGGTLIIGVRDDKEVLGLKGDYGLQRTRQDKDGFEQTLGQILINAIGQQCFARCVKVRFCPLTGKEICILTLKPARAPVYVREQRGDDTMYVRMGNTSRPLNTKEAVSYAAERWGGAPFYLRFGSRRPVASLRGA